MIYATNTYNLKLHLVKQVYVIGSRRSLMIQTGLSVLDLKWTSHGMDLSMIILSQIMKVLTIDDNVSTNTD